MKYKLRTYFHNTTQKGWFWQISPIPSLFICLNKQHFIETGVYGNCWVLSISFLVWDFGIKLEQDYE
jgi:hypothetical protein